MNSVLVNASNELGAFRAGSCRVLVATDIAARGIDVDGVTHVINYDLPNVAESYVHRIGRTARAGATGIAMAFCSNEERPYLRDIEKLTRLPIPVLALPEGFKVEASSFREPSAPRPNHSARPQNPARTDNRQGAPRDGKPGQDRPQQDRAMQDRGGPDRANQTRPRKRRRFSGGGNASAGRSAA